MDQTMIRLLQKTAIRYRAFLLAWINRDTTTRSARRVVNRQHILRTYIHTYVCFHAVLPVGHGAAVFKAGDESLRRGDGGVRRQAAVGGRPRQRRKILETAVKDDVVVRSWASEIKPCR